jgi:hypothetical protein
MNTCRFQSKGCTLSRPCHKCREVALRAAHVLIRFDSAEQRRAGRARDSMRHYGKPGGYWHREAA